MKPTQPYFLSVLVKLLLNDYFHHLNCLNFLSDDEVISTETSKPMVVFDLSKNYNISTTQFNFGCHGFIVTSSRPKFMFELIEDKIRFTVSAKFHERRYLFIPCGGEEYKDNLFSSEKLDFVSDILLIEYLRNDGAYNLWTHKFWGLNDNKQAILMDRWFERNESFLDGVEFYPDKLTNQRGRVLRINTFDYKPYINLETEHGLELMMGLEYAKFYNMTYKLIVETEFWGLFFFNNLSATGAKWTLWSDQSDMSIAQWYSLPDYTRYFDLTESTVRIGVTLLVPGPELAGGWLTPLFSFPYSLWTGFVLSYFVFIISFFFYGYYSISMMSDVNEKVTLILGKSFVTVTVILFLQQSVHIIAGKEGVHLRRLLFFLLIAALLFAALYSAGFASIMTIPRYSKGIETSFDFDASGVKLGGVHPALLDGFRALPEYQNIVKNFLTLSNEEIRHRLHLGNFATIVDRVRTGLVLGKRVDYMDIKKYRVLKDDLYQVYCVMLVKKSSILIPTIMKLFLIIKEAGLPLYWEEMAFQEENYEAIRALRYMKQETPLVKLQWMHVQGAFMVLWLGLVASSICYVVEIITYKRKTGWHSNLFNRRIIVHTE